MSISNSNLSRYRENNTDMTVSVTETALNSQMIQYLASLSTSENADSHRTKVFILSYVGADGEPIMIPIDKNTDYSKLPKGYPEDFYDTAKSLTKNGSSIYDELDKLNLFDIKSGTKVVIDLSKPKVLSDEEQRMQASTAYYLKYGLLMEDGIPDIILQKLIKEKNPLKRQEMLKILTLQPNKKNVSFRQFFRNIRGIQISTNIEGVYPKMKVISTLSKSEQTDENIWYFPFDISLDFRATDYNNCDEDIQKKIRQMAQIDNPDTVFNISQLCLDLQTLSTTMSPTIAGFDHDVDGFILSIIRSYFDRLEKAGQTVFGSVITPKKTSLTNYLFTPKMRNYHVGPKTLDYLIGFGDTNIIPNIGNDNNLAWDTDKEPLIADNNPNNAAIAISSYYFLDFIADIMRPALNYLENKITVSVNTPVDSDHFTLTAKCDLVKSQPDFSVKAKSDNLTFKYSYTNTNETDRHYMWEPPFPSPVASMKLKHSYTASVTGKPGSHSFDKVTLPAYVFDFNLKGWLLIDYNTNTSTQGTYYDHTVTMAVGIRIDSQTGKIDFVKDVIDKDNHPAGLPESGWVKFMSAQHIKGYVNTLTDILNKVLNNIQNYSIDEFVKSVNSHIGFVMPGNKTFTFVYDKCDNAPNAISSNGDLYLFGNYVQELAE